MATITLSLPDDLYARMKKRKEIRWSEIARRAFEETLERLEEIVPAGRFLKEDEVNVNIEKTDWKKVEEAEWKRIRSIYSTRTS